jgi:nitrogen fixation/metabolism regulation signal transduction histidine kinase
LNFREFNSEAIFNLADRKNLQQTVINIVNNSIQDIELLKEKLKNITIV